MRDADNLGNQAEQIDFFRLPLRPPTGTHYGLAPRAPITQVKKNGMIGSFSRLLVAEPCIHSASQTAVAHAAQRKRKQGPAPA